VIEHQELILTRNRFRAVIRFMTTHELWLVVITGCLTWTINLLLLLTMRHSESPKYEYLPERIFKIIKALGLAHIVLAGIMLVQYCVGTALVTLNRGWKWRDMSEWSSPARALICLPSPALDLGYTAGGLCFTL
jgi:hypothetical protein